MAFVTIFLHLLLALVSLSIYHQPCDPPLPPRTQNLRDLALTNYISVGISSLAESPTDTTQRDSSNLDAKKDAKGHVQTLPGKGLSVKENKKASMNMTVSYFRDGASKAEPLEFGLSKLVALFEHPLYNMPSPPIPEEDWLLKVKPKVKAREKSSQMWSVLYIIQ